jgi:hypothetical protein
MLVTLKDDLVLGDRFYRRGKMAVTLMLLALGLNTCFQVFSQI